MTLLSLGGLLIDRCVCESISIDTHPTGTYLLVGQEGGKAHLVTMRPNQNKGNIERTYTSEKIQAMSQKGFPAVFATKGQAVLYGTMNGCALVWDRKKGSIVYGLKHPEGENIRPWFPPVGFSALIRSA